MITIDRLMMNRSMIRDIERENKKQRVNRMIRLHNNIKIECIMMRKDMRERERRMYNRYWQWTMNRR